MKHLSFSTIFTLAILVILLTAGYFFLSWNKSAPLRPGGVACTMEAKLCPDGSYVGRVGLKCEFAACPIKTIPADWQTYNNEKYNYQISYPIDTLVKEAPKDVFSVSPQEVKNGVTTYEYYKKYSGKMCVTLTYKLGYIIIVAPVNEGFKYATCGRTSAAYSLTYKDESLVINGKAYTAKVMVEKGPGETIQYHNETGVVVLDDGTRIEYGSHDNGGNATYADYLKFKPELIKIIESFKAIS